MRLYGLAAATALERSAMMYRKEGGRELSISQPAHAWISG
jgi:hypothetical protein